jgi:hypothetical protein
MRSDEFKDFDGDLFTFVEHFFWSLIRNHKNDYILGEELNIGVYVALTWDTWKAYREPIFIVSQLCLRLK